MTLLELVTVMFIIAILMVMMLPAIGAYRSRIERVACTNNLKNLFIAANSYVQDKGNWPQISPTVLRTNRTQYAKDWINAFRPYGIAEETWVCPTVQHEMGNPDLRDEKSIRIDYLATPFDTNQFTPFRWKTQPWFAERGSVHGNGNLIIFPDGSVQDLNSFVKSSKTK